MRPALLFLLVVCLLTGCAPVFSDFQDARLVEPGQFEVTPAIGYVSAPQYTVGIQGAYGMSQRTEWRARLTHVFVQWETEQNVLAQREFERDVLAGGFSVISTGPKFCLNNDNVAVHLPVEALVSGGSISSVHVHPALLVSIPLSEGALLNPSVNTILPSGLVAVNLGLAFGDLDRWAVRPEVGVLLNGSVIGVGIGFSYRPGGAALAR